MSPAESDALAITIEWEAMIQCSDRYMIALEADVRGSSERSVQRELLLKLLLAAS